MAIKHAVNIPVILVGGITKLEEIEDIINNIDVMQSHNLDHLSSQ